MGACGSMKGGQNSSETRKILYLLRRGKYQEILNDFIIKTPSCLNLSVTNSGTTLFLYLVLEDQVDILTQIFERAGKEQSYLSCLDGFKNTALHLAVLNQSTKMVKLLLDKGADKSALNSSGETPITLAESLESEEIEELITGKSKRKIISSQENTDETKNVEPPQQEHFPEEKVNISQEKIEIIEPEIHEPQPDIYSQIQVSSVREIKIYSEIDDDICNSDRQVVKVSPYKLSLIHI
eukprot:TRINITY_DN7188_c0_g1_i1.p1 TRINITY_DN7188_c0_g1~~TRINITY_DN7188_c0_g1_i1.p1  ORF type:complete len:248 (-),score=37.54 TRINITY_DN7188_c0_g1_i1:182-895(-)